MAEIGDALQQWRSLAEQVYSKCQSNAGSEAHAISDQTVPVHDRLTKLTAELEDLNFKLLQDSEAESSSAVSHATMFLFGLLVVVLIIAAFGVRMVRGTNGELRELARTISEGAEQAASASSQVASSSQSLAQGASEQAATLEETSASSEEITSMTQKNAENCRSVASLMTDTERLVTSGNQTLEDMVGSMQEMNKASEKVSRIIKVIDEIAFQTNILALNAAVEAARAGEAGMGFAVVADEVRSLAQRSAQAAKDTSALIEESLSRSRESAQKLDQVAGAMRSITESATSVKTLVDEVNVSSQEQARGMEQIAKSVSQMDKVTQQTAANAEESASAAEELSAQARAMQAAITKLQELIGSEETSSPRRRQVRPASSDQTAAVDPFAGAAKLSAPPVPAFSSRSAEEEFPLEDFDEA